MAESNVLKRYLDAGMALTQLTQARAEALVKDLVSSGDVQTGQAQTAVNDLLERSRKNTERLLDQIRKEIRDQADSLGLATKADIERLSNQLAELRTSVGQASPSTAASTRAPGAKAPTKKAPVAKASAKKAPVAKKAPTTKKTSAKRAAGDKASS